MMIGRRTLPRAPPGNKMKLKTFETFVLIFVMLVLLTVGFISVSIEFGDRWGYELVEVEVEPEVEVQEQEEIGFDYDPTIPSELSNGSVVVVKQYNPCPIPQLEPFDKFVEHLLAKEPPQMECEKRYPLLFNSTVWSTIVPAKGYEYFKENGYWSCCYRTVGSNEAGRTGKISLTCFPLSLSNETVIPVEHEFIIIYCQTADGGWKQKHDVHAFAHLKTPKNRGREGKGREGKLNVVIFGMGAMSRMNFIRTMPNSYAFLKDELNGVEMLGYNKVGENTPSNLMPMLTSNQLSELSCFHYASLDDCPFIWKKYAEEGYYTSFSEDAIGPGISIFNLDNPGFTKQPTDYYSRPLTQWADSHLGSYQHYQENGRTDGINGCYGPRLTFQYLLDYMEKLLYTMNVNKQNFFHLSWATALIHDNQADGLLGDPQLLKSLKWMKQSGYFNDTVFILMSDHGHQSETFRDTIQGQLEDRLPLLFFVFPDSVKTQHEKVYSTLLSNRDKLVTTYDLYETLNDILNLETIEERSLAWRNTSFVAEELNALPRRISLFHSISENRTCQMAGIKMNFCSCNYLKRTSVLNPLLKDIAKLGVDYINTFVSPQSQCADLELKNVTLAQHTGSTSTRWEGYLINFETKPGGGQFQGLIGRKRGDGRKRKDEGDWKVQGPIARTNSYEKESHCVNDNVLKSYCYCETINEVNSS